MIIKIPNASQRGVGPVSLQCPSCHQQGTFEGIAQVNDCVQGSTTLGQRRCPNPQCRAHVFVVLESDELKATYPPERIDFDTTNIPASVVTALEEAITCHANECYVASGIMVRKTLEELCHDRGATGPNLKERIKALTSKVVLPTDLLNGLDDLRLLGNDAAHIESQVYDQVGQEEVEVGIMFTKEVLKAVFQYSTLVSRLKGLKKAP